MTLDELEKQIKILTDTEEIKKLMRRYVGRLRSVDWDGVVECFTENASVNIGLTGERKGKAEIARLFKEEISQRHIGREYVFVVEPIIDVKGDMATGSWVLYFMFTESDIVPVMSWTQGDYKCEYVKEDGKWKISYLKWRQTVGKTPEKLVELYGDEVE